MKLFWKVFFSFYLLIAISFSLCASFILQASFRFSYDREIEIHLTENEMYRISFGNVLAGIPLDYQKNRQTVENICKSLHNSVGINSEYLAVRDGRINIIYQNKKWEDNSDFFKAVHAGSRGYLVYEKEGHHYLRIISAVKMEASEKTYYIDTVFGMDTVYFQRQEMLRLYRYVVCFLLAACAAISAGLSYLLTHRLLKLSEITGKLAGGELDCRAEVRGKDEIAVLAQDFNQMAENLQEKIEQISSNAQHQEAFTAAFAHELKTPLTAIIGYAELIRSVELSPEERTKAADYIYSQGRRLQKLSLKLMELFAMKQQDMIFQEIPAPYLLRQVSYLVEVSMLRAEMELVLETEEGAIFGEPDLLLSLFSNLVDNARKASKKGQKILLKGISRQDGYTVVVQDKGKGMPSGEIEKITQAFYMVDKSRSRKEGGAGLGMTLCKEIIELHHARWIIESEEGKGTTITIYFPGKETGK